MTTYLNGFGIYGAIEAKWLEKGGQHGVLGVPIGNDQPAFNGVDRAGRIQRFAGGVIAWHPSIGDGMRGGAHEVHGAIAARWHALGEVRFGYPITDEQTPPDETAGPFLSRPSRGRYNHFRAVHVWPDHPESSIYWHPDVAAGAAQEVYGWIRDKWASLGWETSVVGYPVAPEVAGVDTGRVQQFQRGFIAWHHGIGDGGRGGAHEVHGAIAARWHELGETSFGYPFTDEQTPPDKAGRYNHFRAMHVLPDRPESSIYWHNDVGAHEVYGEIRTHWASLGWETSKVGYPVASERPRRGAGRIQDFQTGAVAWAGPRDAWIDWFRMKRTITTPSGTALGGRIELEFHENGHAFFRVHMFNSSSIVSYKFLVRVTFELAPAPRAPAGTLGQSVLFQKSGEVDDKFDWFDPQYHPLLWANWAEVERGTVRIAKSYEKTGLITDVGQFMLDSINFVILGVTVGWPVASAILLAKGLSSVTKAPIGGLGGAFGIVMVAGTSILVGPTFAIPIFIGTAIVTNAIYKQRNMKDEEYEFAGIVFGDTLPPRDRIFLTNFTGVQGRGFTCPGMDATTVFVNIGDDAFNHPGGPMRYTSQYYPCPGQLLIHELVHAWQFYHSSKFVAGYLCRGLGAQIGHSASKITGLELGGSYSPPPAGKSWGSDFGLEQEAATIDQWFGLYAYTRPPPPAPPIPWRTLAELRKLLNSPSARSDQYFRYVENNIRMAEDDHD